jgi:quercetin dioxygenase-like cupin family protein
MRRSATIGSADRPQERTAMRRVTVLASLLAVALAGAFALGRLSAVTGAQDGTPSGEESALPEGLAFELLGVGTADELPTAPADLFLFRLTLDPGAVLPIDAADPSTALIYVESGTLVLRVDAPLTVRRASTPATAAAGGGEEVVPAREQVAAGTEFTLGPGDSFVVPPRRSGGARNDGAGPLALLLAEVAPRQEEGTPVP